VRVAVITLFPELFGPWLRTSLVGRAVETGRLEVALHSLREHGLGKHRGVDDTPYGGGAGMVMRVDCVVAALEAAQAEMHGGARAFRVLLTPQGTRLDQAAVRALVERENVLLVCGRYEGFDERVRSFVDAEVSLGDFVLAGGEVAAMALIEACARTLPGVLGNASSLERESFSDDCGGLLEYPQYTRPRTFRGLEVPDVLTSGDHARIDAWRRERSLERTCERRPDLAPAHGKRGGIQ
jgi:tRNA (guanine37-N1)-methyltransferase